MSLYTRINSLDESFDVKTVIINDIESLIKQMELVSLLAEAKESSDVVNSWKEDLLRLRGALDRVLK